MIVDGRTIADGTRIQVDVCIVGAGAAGITIARALAGAGIEVAVLESGLLEPDASTQALYHGDGTGVPYFPLGDERTRVRQLGGSTNQWTGECRPLEPADFERHPHLPDSGWPFGAHHLGPWYEGAQGICELASIGYAADAWPFEHVAPCASERLAPTVIQHSPPTRFGTVYREELHHDRHITVYLGANVVDLTLGPEGDAVATAQVAGLDGRRCSVAARTFVLATGGIENARLLLAANGGRGIGNEHDLVGRCFMEHLYVDRAARLSVERRAARTLAGHATVGRARARLALTLTAEERARAGCAGAAAVLSWPPRPRWSPARLRRRLPVRARGPVALDVKQIVEQVPNRASRVTLSAERDALGQPRAALDWRLSPLDAHSAAHALGVLDDELLRTGVGTVVARRGGEGWPAGVRGGRHHMGTTRMHADPRRGVVDADARVHSTRNLYVSGSSVFPTAGTANPTLTIVALALRLAGHLRRRHEAVR